MYYCTKCKKRSTPTSKRLCEYCRKLERDSYKDRQRRGICGICGNKLTGHKLCFKCQEKSRRRMKLFRLDVLKHYGQLKCKKCKIADNRVLDLDHIYGGGKKDRKKHGFGHGFYYWLKRNNYQKGYQILCRNCNWIKHLEK